MTNQELTLFTIAGKRAPIYVLPDLPPFMMDADLAIIYGTTTRNITKAVQRRLTRFPQRYSWVLSQDQLDALRFQNGTANPVSSMSRSLPRAFSHGGANMLSGVLTGTVADEVAVAINDAFTEMERRAFAEVQMMLQRLRVDVAKKPIYVWCINAHQYGWTFEQLFQSTNYTRKRLEASVKELVGMGILSEPLAGMQRDLFAHV